MRYYKPKQGPRSDTPTITVPRTLTQATYLNRPLVELLQEKGLEQVAVEVDKEAKEIRLSAPRGDKKGYKIVRTGLRGFGLNYKIRSELPAGKYSLINRRSLRFSRD